MQDTEAHGPHAQHGRTLQSGSPCPDWAIAPHTCGNLVQLIAEKPDADRGRWVQVSWTSDRARLSTVTCVVRFSYTPAMTHDVPQEVHAATGLPWGTTPDGELDRKGVAAGFILGALAVFLTFPLGVLGIVLNCRGLDRIETDPEAARKLLMWSWILFLPGAILGVLLLIRVVTALLS